MEFDQFVKIRVEITSALDADDESILLNVFDSAMRAEPLASPISAISSIGWPALIGESGA
jgi:hypothetical protein